MLKRFLGTLAILVVTVLAVALSVSNRQPVTLVLDPFTPDNPLIAIPGTFFVFLFVTLILGVLLGGFVTWVSQSKWRKMARQQARDAVRWKAEADRLLRERGSETPSSDVRQLTVVK